MRSLLWLFVVGVCVRSTFACSTQAIQGIVAEYDDVEIPDSVLEKIYYTYDENALKEPDPPEPPPEPPTEPPPPEVAPHTHAPPQDDKEDCDCDENGDIELDEPNCKSQILKDILTENMKADYGGDYNVLVQEIQVDATEFFKGEFEVICSTAGFWWRNWFSDKKMCMETLDGVTCLAWKD